VDNGLMIQVSFANKRSEVTFPSTSDAPIGEQKSLSPWEGTPLGRRLT
jgi:hypothetical protein